jgi:multiple antibiotic resistance protein
MIVLSFAFLAFSSLFSVINPISCAPLFVSMTQGMEASRRKLAVRASLAAGITLVIFATLGGAIFSFFGITVPAFQIAGGLLFTLMAIKSLENGDEVQFHDESEREDPSIVPLGIPMIAGPGAISVVMILVGQSKDMLHIVCIGAAILANIGLTLAILLAAPSVAKRMGVTGQKVISKVMGLITAVIGIQFMIDGLTTVYVSIQKSVH